MARWLREANEPATRYIYQRVWGLECNRGYASCASTSCANKKLDMKLLKCTHIGYADNKKAFVCLHHPTDWIFESKDVVFNEKDENSPTCVSINVSTQSVGEMAHPHCQEARDVPPNGPVTPKLGEINLGAQTVSEGETRNAESKQEVEHTLDKKNNLKTSTLSRSMPEPGDIDTSQLQELKIKQKMTHRIQNCSRMQLCLSVHQSVIQRGPPAPYPHPISPPDVCRSTWQRRAPVWDDNVYYFVNTYDKRSLPTPPDGKGNEERSNKITKDLVVQGQEGIEVPSRRLTRNRYLGYDKE